MRSMPIVTMQPARQISGALVRRSMRAGVGPFTEGGLNEAFRPSVGAARMGSRVEFAQSRASIAVGERRERQPAPLSIITPVPAHQQQDAEAELLPPRERAPSPCRFRIFLVRLCRPSSSSTDSQSGKSSAPDAGCTNARAKPCQTSNEATRRASPRSRTASAGRALHPARTGQRPHRRSQRT